jgi:adenine deaminase
VLLRESSLRQDLGGLLKGVRGNPLSLRRVMLTTDGSSPAFHLETGMTDHLLRMALDEGIDPVEAYRMVTLNPAAYFGLEDRLGGLAPGRDADVLVLRDLRDPTPELVISKGRIAAEREAALKKFLSSRGYPYHDPLYTFIFLPNDFLPEVRINFRGVVDIKRDEVLWPARRLHNQAKTQHPAPRFG